MHLNTSCAMQYLYSVHVMVEDVADYSLDIQPACMRANFVPFEESHA